MRLTKPRVNTPLFLQLDKEDSTQYPQAIIIDRMGSVKGVVPLNPVSGVSGAYLGQYTFMEEGDYAVKYAVFKDSARTVLNPVYRLADENFRVTSLEDDVKDLLDGVIGTPIAVFD